MEIKEQVQELVHQITKIKSNTSWNDFQKNKAYFEIFTLILELATKEERLNFTTLFSRLAFVGARYQLYSATMHYSHIFRKAHEQGTIRKDTESLYTVLGHYVSIKLISEIFKIKIDDNDLVIPKELVTFFSKKKEKFIGFRSVVEAVLFEIDTENKTLHFYDEEDPVVEQKALYDIHDRNELFNPNIESLRRTFTLPIHINLIDTDIREDGTYLPAGIIIQPDHLVDVTAVSECFKDFGAEPFLYLIAKFKPAEATAPLMIGNLVNFMLDELISDAEVNFQTLLGKMFHTNPLGFAMLDDHDVQNVITKLKEHFKNLQFAVLNEFKRFDIKRENIFLEPSFYSRDYGIQGRLDLLHQKDGKQIYDIIELKSGKTFKPNVYGINASHYIQTLLYDLMIRSAFHTKVKSSNYILYSKEENPLRFAPPVRAQQYEAMKLRNDLLAIEQKLRNTDKDSSLLSYIKQENFMKLKGFNSSDITNFNNIYTTLSKVEKSYFEHFTAFIAREQSLSKTGEHGINKSNGHAALWLETAEEKVDRFALLANLQIIDNQSDQVDAFITFSRASQDDTLVNFRIGDIGVLYPTLEDNHRSVLKNQIFKCTISNLTSDVVTIRLRAKQNNQRLFSAFQYWNIEQDSLDSGFNTMYKNIFSWAAAPLEYRSLILGLKKPSFHPNHDPIAFEKNVTENQAKLLNKILTCRDYFLLWGPPGTGKTSVMLKNLVKHLHENTTENILLLAYTNRAVDEICEAVINISDAYHNHFLRMGSRLSTDDRFANNLLDQVIKNTKSRQEIIQLLAEKRIYISTVSSIVNKTELFQLKDFDTVIIDEASQILEPMLVGLLSKFKRFILIGDHKQLPAVVVQDGESSSVKDENLRNLGINDTRISLFERLYMQVRQNDWTDAYGILEQQGRMHENLMTFVNTHFYEGKLQILPGLKRQTMDYFLKDEKYGNLNHRMVYIPSALDEDINWKTNKNEAEIVTKTISDLFQMFASNDKVITHESIGIITPYRAQIALIRKYMEVLPKELAAKITVDTVERYQGGARDIIIISFCVNRLSQLDALVSLSQEGIDRKLNVALTRAKEQIILIGNEDILSKNTVYKTLLESCK
jgi:DNA replication ATP-dependent helicase Dna2